MFPLTGPSQLSGSCILKERKCINSFQRKPHVEHITVANLRCEHGWLWANNICPPKSTADAPAKADERYSSLHKLTKLPVKNWIEGFSQIMNLTLLSRIGLAPSLPLGKSLTHRTSVFPGLSSSWFVCFICLFVKVFLYHHILKCRGSLHCENTKYHLKYK